MPKWKGKKVSRKRLLELSTNAERRIIGIDYGFIYSGDPHTIGGNKNSKVNHLIRYRGREGAMNFENTKIFIDGNEFGGTVKAEINKPNEISQSFVFDNSFSVEAEIDMKGWPAITSFPNVSIDANTLLKMWGSNQKLLEYMD